jgi:hypothetical protein
MKGKVANFVKTFFRLSTLVAFLLKKDWWWIIAVPALVLSQILIIMSWQDAKFGTIANVVILASIILSSGIWSFNEMVRQGPAIPLISCTSISA